MSRINVYLKLVRPANLLTAAADVLAGVAISGYFAEGFVAVPSIVLLVISTMALYGGGIVFNDIFDRQIDAVERPERAIPRGLISLRRARILGMVLLISGVLIAFIVSSVSGLLAFLIAGLALLYNKVSKHHGFFGPLNMGACRGLNLLLGISILPLMLSELAFIGIVPLLYIYSITMISQGEVHGGNRRKLYVAAVLYALVLGMILGFAFSNGTVLTTSIFLMIYGVMIFRPLVRAINDPVGRNIGKAVKAGVISLILMDAAWAAASSELWAAVAIAAMLPVSLWLAKRFAVT